MGSSQSRAQRRVESLRRDALNRYALRLLAAGFTEDTEFAKRQGKLSSTRRFYREGFGAINTRVYATQHLSLDNVNKLIIQTSTSTEQLVEMFQKSFTDVQPLSMNCSANARDANAKTILFSREVYEQPLILSRCACASEVIAMVPVEDMCLNQQINPSGDKKSIYATLVAIEGLPTITIMMDQRHRLYSSDQKEPLRILQIQHDPSIQEIGSATVY
jgi:hypothetical protein